MAGCGWCRHCHQRRCVWRHNGSDDIRRSDYCCWHDYTRRYSRPRSMAARVSAATQSVTSCSLTHDHAARQALCRSEWLSAWVKRHSSVLHQPIVDYCRHGHLCDQRDHQLPTLLAVWLGRCRIRVALALRPSWRLAQAFWSTAAAIQATA